MISGIDYGKGNDESCTITFVSPEYIEQLEQENQQLKSVIKEATERLEALIIFWKKYNPIDNTLQVEQFKGVINMLKGDK